MQTIPQIHDMFDVPLGIGDKVIYTTSSKWTMLVHAEITNVYEVDYGTGNYTQKVTKVQVRPIVQGEAVWQPGISTVEYDSRKFYKL